MQPKEKLDAIGVAVRAGVITPTINDESSVRNLLSLPEMSEDVVTEWEKNPIRSPITLTNALAETDEATPSPLPEDSTSNEQ